MSFSAISIYHAFCAMILIQTSYCFQSTIKRVNPSAHVISMQWTFKRNGQKINEAGFLSP